MNGIRNFAALVSLVCMVVVFAGSGTAGADNPPQGTNSQIQNTRNPQRTAPQGMKPGAANQKGVPQKGVPQQGAPQKGQSPIVDSAEMKKRIIEERNQKMKTELGLDDAKAKKLFDVLTKYDTLIDEDMRDTMKFKEEVVNVVKAGEVSDKQAKEFVDKYEKREQATYDIRQKRSAEIKKLLSSKEMLKFVMFEKRFNQRMSEFAGAGRPQQGGPGGKGAFRGNPGGNNVGAQQGGQKPQQRKPQAPSPRRVSPLQQGGGAAPQQPR